MPAVSRPKKIDALMEEATRALAATRYFEAERIAAKALDLARQSHDYGRMARITLPLQEARRQRVQQALDVGTVTLVTKPVGERVKVSAGCYLVQPPQVGADARRLRLAAMEHEVPVAVVCRETITQIGLCPIVAIAPGVTIRTKIDPPDDLDEPDMTWFVEAMEAIGEDAIITIDPGLPVHKRLDLLLSRLDAIPEHEGLHQALADVCREAEREMAEGAEPVHHEDEVEHDVADEDEAPPAPPKRPAPRRKKR